VEQARELEALVLIVGTMPDFTTTEEGEIIARDVVDCFLRKERKGFVVP
jgi:quinate dehydrogenase